MKKFQAFKFNKLENIKTDQFKTHRIRRTFIINFKKIRLSCKLTNILNKSMILASPIIHIPITNRV